MFCDQRRGYVTELPARQKLYSQAAQAAWLGLAVNCSLGVVKLIGGLVGQSFALVADAVNSLGDSVSSVIVLYALRVACQPPDEEHPYGHSKAEAIAASNVALLIIISAAAIGWEAITRLGSPQVVPSWWTLLIAAANVVLKEGLYHYNAQLGRRLSSSALTAAAWDHRSDAACSLAVLVGLLVILTGGETWAAADEVAGLVVVGFILYSGTKMVRETAAGLMDQQAEPELVDQIRRAAHVDDQVLDVEKLWVRRAGLEFFVEVHLQVDPAMSVAEGHEVGHRVHDQLLAQFPMIRDVLVHLEPYEP